MRTAARTWIVLAALVLAGCITDESANQGRLIVQGKDGDQMAALIEGIVTIDDGCALIESGEQNLGLVWPVGTTWKSESESVRLVSGVEISSGVEIRAGGGGASADHLQGYPDDVLGPTRLTPERLACADQWWVLGLAEEIEVLD